MTTGARPADDGLIPPAVDTLPINLAVLDSEGTIRWTNRAWREFGRANDIAMRSDTVGINYLEVTAAADDSTAREAAAGLEAVLAGEAEGFELEYPCHSPEEKRWFLMRVAPFTVAGDRCAAVAHVDITERVRQERAVERFERIIETAGQAVFITDADGTITYVNPAFEKITGYSAEEAVGGTPQLLKSGEHDDAFYDDLWGTIVAGDQWEGTIVNRRKSGALYYAHQTITPVTAGGEVRQFVALQTEITDIEEMKQQLRAHDDILRHDLRTQLNVVLAHAEQLAESGADRDHTDAIVGAVRRLLSTAEKTRDLRRFLERTTEPSPVDLVPVVRDAVATGRERFPTAEITAETSAEAVALSVADIGRAVAELIENGVVHSDQRTPRVRVEVREEGDCVAVTVADAGPGIPSMEYETFEGEHPTPVRHRSGVGLDMAYWIARRSGGQLRVTDRDPRGSRVTIRLPKPDAAELGDG